MMNLNLWLAYFTVATNILLKILKNLKIGLILILWACGIPSKDTCRLEGVTLASFCELPQSFVPVICCWWYLLKLKNKQCCTQSFFRHSSNVAELGLQQKYWRVHHPTDRPTKVMALFSCFSMLISQTTKQSYKIIG